MKALFLGLTAIVCTSTTTFAQDEGPRFQCKAEIRHKSKEPLDIKAFDIIPKCFPAAPNKPCNYIFVDTTGIIRKQTSSYFQKVSLPGSNETLAGDMVVTKDESVSKTQIEVDLSTKLIDPDGQTIAGSNVLFLPSDTKTIHAIVYGGAGSKEGHYEKQPSLEVDCSLTDKMILHLPMHRQAKL